jgi:hypothetical protein
MGRVVGEAKSGAGRGGRSHLLLIVGVGLIADGKVFFMPGFFLPPDNINAMKHVDGMFNWNSAW